MKFFSGNPSQTLNDNQVLKGKQIVARIDRSVIKIEKKI